MVKDPAILVQGLVKSYKQVDVLKDVNFSVRKGSIFALLGSNGAGKTTVIKILTTLLKEDKGNIQVGSFNVTKQAERVREIISLTGQYVAVDDILTGRENLHLIGKLRHINKVKEKSDDLLKRFDLAEAADRYVATYSGGMRRRLDLAMSLMGSPSIVFLDEPTTGLDPQARLEMWKIIKELTKSNVTVFLTTQYLEEADQLADYIAILHKGKIAAEGTPQELKKLLPQGHIELHFNDTNNFTNATNLLLECNPNLNNENLIVRIQTDGTIKQMMNIFSLLEEAKINMMDHLMHLTYKLFENQESVVIKA